MGSQEEPLKVVDESSSPPLGEASTSVDAGLVITKLQNQIAGLHLQIAMLEAALDQERARSAG